MLLVFGKLSTNKFIQILLSLSLISFLLLLVLVQLLHYFWFRNPYLVVKKTHKLFNQKHNKEEEEEETTKVGVAVVEVAKLRIQFD